MRRIINTIAKYVLITSCIANSIAVMACSDNTVKIESLADSGMGYWSKKSEFEYEYRISNMNKEKILQDELKKSEKTRNSKVLLGIMYISDIDRTFLSIGTNSFGIDSGNRETLIQGRDKDYLIVFEAYKSIYFPKSIRVKRK